MCSKQHCQLDWPLKRFLCVFSHHVVWHFSLVYKLMVTLFFCLSEHPQCSTFVIRSFIDYDELIHFTGTQSLCFVRKFKRLFSMSNVIEANRIGSRWWSGFQLNRHVYQYQRRCSEAISSLLQFITKETVLLKCIPFANGSFLRIVILFENLLGIFVCASHKEGKYLIGKHQ